MNLPSTSSLATDTQGLNALRASASRDPKAAIKEAAKQFESLFMQELMKSMRKATLSSGMLDNAGTQMGTDMLDDQFAVKMSGLPGGLSAVIARQLERQTVGAAAVPVAAAAAAGAPSAALRGAPASERQSAFVQQHTGAARTAEAQTGIPAGFMVAQAAHESGWGRREIRHADGSPSFNLFGIKAGATWKGPVAEVITTEYVGGEARKVSAKFRAYASHEASFLDYAKLMKESPRYAGVVAGGGTAEGFAQGLQRAGYATDPAYADKLSRVINTTLRLQRALT
jgi:peptidoglycan hydrolase FlgJ